MNGQYILKDGQPVLCDDLMKWGRWMQTADRRVGYDETPNGRVSTVFLGLDHGWNGELELYETMVFGGTLDQEQVRYATREQAEEGHKKTLARVIAGEKP